jgi:N-methylhydantoinase B
MTKRIDPIQLEVFKHRFSAIAEEMGVVLRKSSFSSNIKERRDFSCAIFDALGRMIAQAEHIPVHLGSMPLSVKEILNSYRGKLTPGDMIILNDPFKGGTHLPDITLITPVFTNSNDMSRKSYLCGFVASRAHHSDIGGMTPGSMPVAREIFQEGLIIPPTKIMKAGEINHEVMTLILANVRTPREREGDIWAQIAANQRGTQRLIELVTTHGKDIVENFMGELLTYTDKMTRSLLKSIPDGAYQYSDFLDNNGITEGQVMINVSITIRGDTALVDFTGSAPQQPGSINAVLPITMSAVYYVFRCLLAEDIPNNEGCLYAINITAPKGTVVNAIHPAAVAGGNVETSQRIVDVLLGAMSKGLPDLIPAASQGTMNNITIGGKSKGQQFTYYETIGGGVGANNGGDGPSGVHSHMTNTLNTPIEALEYEFPFRMVRYEIRKGSGGEGKYRGGDGIRRDIQVLTEAQATILTERRELAPYGLDGGQPGHVGENLLIRDSNITKLPGKGTFDLENGDILSIRTPGGGGFGSG